MYILPAALLCDLTFLTALVSLCSKLLRDQSNIAYMPLKSILHWCLCTFKVNQDMKYETIDFIGPDIHDIQRLNINGTIYLVY